MKKVFSTLVFGILLSVSAYSGNNIGNGGFEFSTGTLSAWNASSTSPGTQTYVLDSENPISGNQSALITIVTPATPSTDDLTNAGKLFLGTNLALTKGATYKFTFKAKATNADGIDLSEVVMPVKIVTGSGVTPVTTLLDDYVILTSSVQTHELMFACNIVASYCNLRFEYGNFPAGTSIVLDDVVLEEITNPLTNGNLCNGDFESVAFGKPAGSLSGYAPYTDQGATSSTGWTQLKPSNSGASFNVYASAYDPIVGDKALRIDKAKDAPSGENNAAYMVGWAFCPAVGKYYTCTFKAKSSVETVDIGVKLISYDGGIVNKDELTGYIITPAPNSYTFTSNIVADYSFYYLLCLQVGTLPPNAYIMLDDVVLYQSDGPNSGLKQISDRDDVKVFGNNTGISVTTPIKAQATVYSISGRIEKIQPLAIGENQFSMPKGAYIVQIENEKEIIKSTKLIVR